MYFFKMKSFLAKTFKFLNAPGQGTNQVIGIAKALLEENESLKERLNFYANSHFRNKERWEFLSYMLKSHDYNQTFDDYISKIKERVSKYVGYNDVHLVIYSKEEINKIYTVRAESNFLTKNKKYLEKAHYEQISKNHLQGFGLHFEIYKIRGDKKDYGYVILGNKNKEVLEDIRNFIDPIVQVLAKILVHNENNKDFENDSQNKIEFLVNFSHEIKTPLNGIIIYSELLKNEEKNLGDEAKKYIKNINVSARQLNYLMTYITESAKTKYSQLKINKEKFFTNTEISNILSVFHSKIIEKNLEIETILTDVELNSDIAKFNQILYNLISNAIKYSPHNSQITLSSWVENEEFNFEIKDEGYGISEKESDKMFKFLSRGSGKEQTEGSGIGLAFTKKIIEIQGGKIGYISEADKGTTFWFRLPLDGGL